MNEKTWLIPAKTFLVGEYAALHHQGAILLTTTPCFRITLTQKPGLTGIHAESPAGRFWQANSETTTTTFGLTFDDPYNGLGGMGASSAQFIGAYLATTFLKKQKPSLDAMLQSYWHFSYQGHGLKPSGYDLIAQSMSTFMAIHHQQRQYNPLNWNFQDIGFLLVHTNQKLATHVHLAQTQIQNDTTILHSLVLEAKKAILLQDSHALIAAVNAYHNSLDAMHLVGHNTLQLLTHLKKQSPILAAKGCGALGADILLCIVPKDALPAAKSCIEALELTCIASHEDLLQARTYDRHPPIFSTHCLTGR